MTEHQTTMTPLAQAGLEKYLAARQEARERRFDEQWAYLSAREKSLVREAAVMGYVRGTGFGESRASRPRAERAEFPKDDLIVRDVFGGCEAHSDLYPTIASLGEDYAEAVDEWLVKQDGIDAAKIANLTPDERHNATLNYLKWWREGGDEEE